MAKRNSDVIDQLAQEPGSCIERALKAESEHPQHPDGEPYTREQLQSLIASVQSVAPEALLTPETTRLPASQLGDVLRYLPALVAIVSELKQFGALQAGDSRDFGPLTTWLPTGGDYEITLHVTRKS